ncbi:MAG: helix-turn-helix domain-containing protein [Clostridia bacterium]|nr:helix-turn-helix domain-containing protein [Clostridia bacterium]
MTKIKELREQKNISMAQAAKELGFPYTTYVNYEKGEREPRSEALIKIAQYFGVSTDYILGRESAPAPTITEDYVTFPVLYDVAAGFDKMAMAIDEWEGETIDIPRSYIHGEKEDYAVIRVKGDSMYPDYKDGDRVLLKKQPTLDYSGQVGVLVYEDCATLKRVDFVKGEDWLLMRPINPNFPPQRIEGAALDQCRIVGVPKVLVRTIKD